MVPPYMGNLCAIWGDLGRTLPCLARRIVGTLLQRFDWVRPFSSGRLDKREDDSPASSKGATICVARKLERKTGDQWGDNGNERREEWRERDVE